MTSQLNKLLYNISKSSNTKIHLINPSISSIFTHQNQFSISPKTNSSNFIISSSLIQRHYFAATSTSSNEATQKNVTSVADILDLENTDNIDTKLSSINLETTNSKEGTEIKEEIVNSNNNNDDNTSNNSKNAKSDNDSTLNLGSISLSDSDSDSDSDSASSADSSDSDDGSASGSNSDGDSDGSDGDSSSDWDSDSDKDDDNDKESDSDTDWDSDSDDDNNVKSKDVSDKQSSRSTSTSTSPSPFGNERRQSQFEGRRELGDIQANRLMISSLNFYTNRNDLWELCEEYGTILDVHIPLNRDKQSQNRGFGFITFETDEDAAKAKEALDNLSFQSRNIRVQYARERSPEQQNRFNASRTFRDQNEQQTQQNQQTDLHFGTNNNNKENEGDVPDIFGIFDSSEKDNEKPKEKEIENVNVNVNKKESLISNIPIMTPHSELHETTITINNLPDNLITKEQLTKMFESIGLGNVTNVNIISNATITLQLKNQNQNQADLSSLRGVVNDVNTSSVNVASSSTKSSGSSIWSKDIEDLINDDNGNTETQSTPNGTILASTSRNKNVTLDKVKAQTTKKAETKKDDGDDDDDDDDLFDQLFGDVSSDSDSD